MDISWDILPELLTYIAVISGTVAIELNATFTARRTSTELWIECYPSNKSDINTVYFITISKEGFGDIITIRDENKIEWKNTDLQHRVSVNGSVVTPVKDAILIISIDSVYVQCTDSGDYSCIINGFGFANRPFQQTATTQLNLCPHATSSTRKVSISDSYFMGFSLFMLLYLQNG